VRLCDKARRMNKPRPILTTCLALLAGFGSTLPIFGSEAVLTDDTTANRAIPHAFYHTHPTLGVGANAQGINKLAFLKFDLVNLPAGTPSAQISKATLRVYCDSIAKPGRIDIAPVMTPWLESTVTGAISPALGEVELRGTAVKLTDKRHWVSFDVTQLVRDWADGTFPNNGLALVPEFTLGIGGIVANFDSKENAATSHEPVLDIVLVGNGEAGPPGIAGPKGDIGPTGPKGDPGAKGDAGLTGPQGATGPTGPQGVQGPAGIAGPQGSTGPKGDTGPAGAVGATGAKGDPGATGAQGPAGSIGPAGPIGPIGPVGPKGDPGAGGPQGIAGPQGPAGPMGDQGLAGPQGPVGQQGPVGPAGSVGPAGRTALGGLTPARLGTLRWYHANSAYVGTSLGTTSLPLGLCFDGSFIWTAESGGNQVTKLRLDGSTVGSYAVTGSPQFCVAAGDFIWVSRKNTNSVTKLNADSGSVAVTVAVGTAPSYLCFDGTYIWVADTGSDDLTKIKASDNTVQTGSYVVQSPRGICFDGAVLWVCSFTTNSVVKLDPRNGAVLGSFPVGAQRR